MSEQSRSPQPKVVISGSFHHHLEAIRDVKSAFEHFGAIVLSPKTIFVESEDDEGFVYFKGEKGPAAYIEWAHLHAIGTADLMYIVTRDNYLGQSAAMEIGYALARGTPIFASDPIDISPHKYLVQQASVEEAIKSVQKKHFSPPLPEEPTLAQLQQFYSQLSKLRGFHEETPVQILLLLVEEIGELAKALRATEDLTVSATDPAPKDLAFELADCFNYLLHLANRTGVDLCAAFREKEQINASRIWTRPSRM